MATKLLFFILSLLAIYILAFAWSSNRRLIRYKYLFIILIVQLVLAKFMLSTTAGIEIIGAVNDAFAVLLSSAHVGVSFVFGGGAVRAPLAHSKSALPFWLPGRRTEHVRPELLRNPVRCFNPR